VPHRFASRTEHCFKTGSTFSSSGTQRAHETEFIGTSREGMSRIANECKGVAGPAAAIESTLLAALVCAHTLMLLLADRG